MIDVADCLYAMGCCSDAVRAVRSWSRRQQPQDRTATRLLLDLGTATWSTAGGGSGIQWIRWIANETSGTCGGGVQDMRSDADVCEIRAEIAEAVSRMAALDPREFPGRSDWGPSRKRIALARRLLPKLRRAGLV